MTISTEAPSRRAALGAIIAAGALLPTPLSAAGYAEDGEIFGLRAEHERLMTARPPLDRAIDELYPSFYDFCRKEGTAAAFAGRDETRDYWEANSKLEEIGIRTGEIAERMIALRPKTLADLAAVAATLKEWTLKHYWDRPDIDMDWDIAMITQFVDSLIELGQTPPA